jgi:ribose transport system ATP-binding protein
MKSKDVSLAVNPGEVHAIIDENGAGKSTLMKLLAGHLQPTRGELRIDGETVTLTGPVDAERRGIVLFSRKSLLRPISRSPRMCISARSCPRAWSSTIVQ